MIKQKNSYWPLLTQLLAILLTSGFLFGGIRWIERANLFLVPLLLLIIVFTFVWSLTRDYAEIGIAYLFTPSWVSHRLAVSIAIIACTIVGVPSALSLHVLENQDTTWGYGLIVSGFLIALVVVVYKPMRFRRVLVNQFGTDDWKAPLLWIPVIA
ncbi:uncharacterized protein DEA37_0009747 [Paragonimus westermani]|uniref:Uncharacterized protein n=1 Tax=Paragonimus westermani TaxID=34504 RepID=A0A5J4P0I3_9TREM|nr:uncharacterized protein DEA37_0009747 [Paragonimus westermani]